MEKLPDWITFWEQLSKNQEKSFKYKNKPKDKDVWRDRAKGFDKMVEDRWKNPDSTRLFLTETLKKNPGSTVLDIGAGTGAWSVYMAPDAKSVTALDPSRAMLEVLEEKIKSRNIRNIKLLNGSWPDVEVESHDFLLASHSMYGIPDFRAFIEKMVATARKSCFLCMRALHNDTIMAKATQKLWGQPYDSPNFQIALNAMHQMNIYPNVLMETGGQWLGWTSDSMEDALNEIKHRLGVENTTEFDDYFNSLLEGQLVHENDKWHWPAGNSSALVYWDV